MRRGTTPTHTFTLPFDAEKVSGLSITYVQAGSKVLRKTETDVTIAGNTVTLKLTQAETLKFDTREMVEIQLKIRVGTDVLVSDIWRVASLRCLDEEEL